MKHRSNPSRRYFLKSAALATPIMLGGLQSEAQTRPAAHSVVTASFEAGASRNYPGKDTRLSISMWDFSWLQSGYPGGPYENLEQRVAEAQERGYNTLRVDCFPSRLLEPISHFEKNWATGDLPAWGMTAEAFSCNVRERLRGFAALCRKHDLWLGLDTWDLDHMFTAALPELWKSQHITVVDEDTAFTRCGELWARALKLMREDGVLEQAVWVAPMNEVPHFEGHLDSVIAVKNRLKNDSITKSIAAAELDAIYRRINVSMGAPIKSEIAKDGIPLSYSSITSENYAARVSDIYDVVDIHFMPGVIEDDEDKRAFQRVGPGAPNGRFHELKKFDLKAYSTTWDNACRRHYPAMLEQASNYFKTALEHMTLPSGKRLHAIVTEAYGPCYWPDCPNVDWEWYKLYNADALRVVASMDFTGATLSNYGEPLFTLWNDPGWHWAGNNYFRTALPGVSG